MWPVHRLSACQWWEYTYVYVDQRGLIQQSGVPGMCLVGIPIASVQGIQAVILGKGVPELQANRCSAPESNALFFSLEIEGGTHINIRCCSFTQRYQIVMALMQQLTTMDVVGKSRIQICSMSPEDIFMIRFRDDEQWECKLKQAESELKMAQSCEQRVKCQIMSKQREIKESERRAVRSNLNKHLHWTSAAALESDCPVHGQPKAVGTGDASNLHQQWGCVVAELTEELKKAREKVEESEKREKHAQKDVERIKEQMSE